MGIFLALIFVAFGAVAPAYGTVRGENGKVVYSTSQGIYAANSDGTGVRRLAPQDYAGLPHWSPDGTKIIFTHSSGAYVMNSDGSERTLLPISGGAMSWSPDGTQIAFATNATGIRILDVASGQTTPLTGTDTYHPAWSPDGTRIAFGRSTTPGVWEIWTMAANGTDQVLLFSATDPVSLPDWAPDGSAIVFGHGGMDEPNSVYRVDADGSDPTRLTTVGRNSYPTWSPDGAKIAFVSDRGTGMWVMDPDGSNQMRVNTIRGLSQPSWQPVNVRLEASSAQVPFGDAVILYARLVPHETTANDTVSLYAIPHGGDKVLVESGEVDSAGEISLTTQPDRNTRYIAEWTGDGDYPAGAGSDFVPINVRADITGTLVGSYAKPGKYHLYHYASSCPRRHTRCPRYEVEVAPGHPLHRVRFFLEIYFAGRWREVLDFRRRLEEDSSTVVVYVYGDRSVIGRRLRTRAQFPGDADHLRSRTGWSYFKVTN